MIESTMDPNTAKEILHVIRNKQKTKPVTERPPKAIFGSDMDSPNSMDNLWREMMQRQKIKKRMEAAKQRRNDKIKRLEALIKEHEGDESSITRDAMKSAINSLKSENNSESPRLESSSNNVSALDEKPSTSASHMSLSGSENSKRVTTSSEVQVHRSDVEADMRSTLQEEDPSPEVKSSVSNASKSGGDNSDVDMLSKSSDREKLDDSHEGSESFRTDDSNLQETNTPNEQKPRSRWKQHRILPLATACFKLKRRIKEENESQMDLLETIRVLRGISKDEFYKDIGRPSDSESSDDEEKDGKDEEPAENPPPEPEQVEEQDEEEGEVLPEETLPEVEKTEEVEEEDEDLLEEEEDLRENVVSGTGNEGDDERSLVQASETKSPQERTIVNDLNQGYRVDSRWPRGHRLHTKPAEMNYVSVYLQPITGKKKPTKSSVQQSQENNVSRYQDNMNEYEVWREQLLQIAYLKEFDHLKGKSLKTFTVPLPDISISQKGREYKQASDTGAELQNGKGSESKSQLNDQVRRSKPSRINSVAKNTIHRQPSVRRVYENPQVDLPFLKNIDHKENSYIGLHKKSKKVKYSKSESIDKLSHSKDIKTEIKEIKWRKKNKKALIDSTFRERRNNSHIEIADNNQSTDSAINEPSSHSELESDAEIYSKLSAGHDVTTDDYGNKIITYRNHAQGNSPMHIALPSTERLIRSQSYTGSLVAVRNKQSQEKRAMAGYHGIRSKHIDSVIKSKLLQRSKSMTDLRNSCSSQENGSFKSQTETDPTSTIPENDCNKHKKLKKRRSLRTKYRYK